MGGAKGPGRARTVVTVRREGDRKNRSAKCHGNSANRILSREKIRELGRERVRLGAEQPEGAGRSAMGAVRSAVEMSRGIATRKEEARSASRK